MLHLSAAAAAEQSTQHSSRACRGCLPTPRMLAAAGRVQACRAKGDWLLIGSIMERVRATPCWSTTRRPRRQAGAARHAVFTSPALKLRRPPEKQESRVQRSPDAGTHAADEEPAAAASAVRRAARDKSGQCSSRNSHDTQASQRSRSDAAGAPCGQQRAAAATQLSCISAAAVLLQRERSTSAPHHCTAAAWSRQSRPQGSQSASLQLQHAAAPPHLLPQDRRRSSSAMSTPPCQGGTARHGTTPPRRHRRGGGGSWMPRAGAHDDMHGCVVSPLVSLPDAAGLRLSCGAAADEQLQLSTIQLLAVPGFGTQHGAFAAPQENVGFSAQHHRGAVLLPRTAAEVGASAAGSAC